MIAAPLLAFAAWRDAAAEYWLKAGPERAPGVLQADARIALARLDSEQADEARETKSTARAALRTEALNAAAMRLLGSAEPAPAQPADVARMQLAERISRRDAPTQAILLQRAAADQDYRGTFRHLDTMLTTSPQAGEQLFPPLTTLLGDPEVRRVLARYGNRAWFDTFTATAVQEIEAPADLAALLMASHAPASAAGLAILPRLLTRLVDEGRYAAAKDLALRFGKARPRALDDFAMNAASSDLRFAPLTWQLAQADAAEVGLAPEGRLDVRLRPGVVVALAQRATVLVPGAYTIDQRAVRSDGDGTLLVAWELYCRRDDRPQRIWRQPLPMTPKETRYRIRIEVPADCPLQYWRLTGLADESQSDAHFTLAGVQITPTAPRQPSPPLPSTRTMLR